MGCPGVFAFLVGRSALFRFRRRGIASAERCTRRSLQMTNELSDEVLLIHAGSFATQLARGKISVANHSGATDFLMRSLTFATFTYGLLGEKLPVGDHRKSMWLFSPSLQ